MKNLSSVADIRAWRKSARGTVGFVPTMGALHAGHAELLKQARQNCDHVVLSIFVNPTQFNDPKDLEKYPRTLEADLEIARQAGVDLTWTPTAEELYADQYALKVVETGISGQLEGAYRPGHFEGMLTVVLKLLQVVQADIAYFGEKDYQQLKLIERMAQAFFLPTRIQPVPTVREADGLAMSSRNLRLTESERNLAPKFFAILKSATSASLAFQQLTNLGFKVDYVEDWQNRRLAAAHLGSVRLIDNIEIPGGSR